MHKRPKSRLRKRLENAFCRALSYGLYWGLAAVPLGLARLFARAAGVATYLILRTRRHVALQNLRQAFPEKGERELRQIARGAVQNLALTVIEFLRGARIPDHKFLRLVHMRGQEHFDQALQQGKGVIYLTGHFGNWEWMARRIVLGGYPLDVLARTQDDERTENLVYRLRTAAGMGVISRTSARAALRTLRENRILGILADQHTLAGGVSVDLFGRPAVTPILPYVFARRTGAPVLVGFCFRQPDGTYQFEVSPPLVLANTGDQQADDRANARQFNRMLEEAVRSRPAHWLWMHRRWRSLPSEEERTT